jgi:hypothetical protein
MNMEQYIISGIFALLVALIEAVAAKERKEIKTENTKAAAREAMRAEESRLSIQMMSAHAAIIRCYCQCTHRRTQQWECRKSANSGRGSYDGIYSFH